jgi:hypothetical protein
MSTKLLNDVASILAELGVSRSAAYTVFEVLVDDLHINNDVVDDLADTASNAPLGGECGC